MYFFLFILFIPMSLLFLKIKRLLEFSLILEITYLNLMMIIMMNFWLISNLELMNIFMFFMILVCDASLNLLLVVLMNRNWSMDSLFFKSSLN